MAAEQNPERIKRAASAVQKLRGWKDTDPTRLADFADALVEVTELRLASGAASEAAAEAGESLSIAGRLLAANGPLGPYTAAVDATRFLRAAGQLAEVQTVLGAREAAAAVVNGAASVLDQLAHLRLEMDPATRVRCCLALSLAALPQRPEAANSWADAAVAGLEPVVPRVLEARVLALAAAARSAAGDPGAALGWALATRRLVRESWPPPPDPDRMPPTRLERVGELDALASRTLAEVLLAGGDRDWSLAVGRQLVERLDRWVSRAPALEVVLTASEERFAADLTATAQPVARLATWPQASGPWVTPGSGERLSRWDAAVSARKLAAVAQERPAEVTAELERRRELDEAAAAGLAEEQRLLLEQARIEEAGRIAKVEAEAVERTRRGAAEAADRELSQQRRAERLAGYRREQLLARRDRVRQAVAGASDRTAVKVALEELVDVLDELAAESPASDGSDLVSALQDLAQARLRAGDWWGSRAPQRRARELSRAWGLP